MTSYPFCTLAYEFAYFLSYCLKYGENFSNSKYILKNLRGNPNLLLSGPIFFLPLWLISP